MALDSLEAAIVPLVFRLLATQLPLIETMLLTVAKVRFDLWDFGR